MQTKSSRYVYRKRDTYYFSRRVPSDLEQHYIKKRIVICLRTSSAHVAKQSANTIAVRLDDYWRTLRLQAMELPAAHLILASSSTGQSTGPKLSDALEIYLSLKAKNNDKVFCRTATRNIQNVIDLLGDRCIDAYASSDAATFRDHLFKRGLSSSSVKRMFTAIRSIINLVITEHGLDAKNAFAKTYMPDMGDVNDRKPFPIEDVRRIQQICIHTDDDMRWLVALVSDTGMRLSEAAALLKSDIHIDCEYPYAEVKPYPWRKLKTASSTRTVPLVGSSLWAVSRIMQKENGDFAFPRYASREECKSNSASAALNKWLSNYVDDGLVMHSFRHSLRDRLRAVECPADIVDKIGGWQTAGIGQGYGNGYPLDVLHKWMVMI
jgi:integrase